MKKMTLFFILILSVLALNLTGINPEKSLVKKSFPINDEGPTKPPKGEKKSC